MVDPVSTVWSIVSLTVFFRDYYPRFSVLFIVLAPLQSMSTWNYTLLFHLRFCLHLETATIGQMCPLAPTADQKVVLQMGLSRE